jgi:hypothetical protein
MKDSITAGIDAKVNVNVALEFNPRGMMGDFVGALMHALAEKRRVHCELIRLEAEEKCVDVSIRSIEIQIAAAEFGYGLQERTPVGGSTLPLRDGLSSPLGALPGDNVAGLNQACAHLDQGVFDKLRIPKC